MKKRALVLCEDLWHPAKTVQRGLDALAEQQFEFKFLAHGAGWSPSLMQTFPLVIVAKANHVCAANQNPWLTPETEPAFADFVRAGGGLVLLHAGTCYQDLPAMRSVTGGAFLSHPHQCPVVMQPKPGHPLTAGTDTFVEDDEHYLMALDADDADVFLQTRSPHGTQPAGWTRPVGAGRVCALTPGHRLAVWLNPNYQILLRNALRWTARLN